MMEQSQYTLKGRNPDVLTCIANLSNDEVFTPPVFANQMLDTLAEAWASSHGGADLWADRNVTFLDPCTKSGVFLREITSRLIKGLSEEIPDLQERVDHILTKQVFGIGITRITSLLARRSVYCSRLAKGRHSIVKSFKHNDGNIWFQRLEHTWEGNKCKFCGAPKSLLDRDESLENYAYGFIHSDDVASKIYKLFGRTMQFDVIIGNPPYQMKGGAGGSSDSSIYHLFVEQAQKLDPKFLSMVVPSRWLAGGRGLGKFREGMLGSKKILRLVDFPVSKEVFPNVEVKGGICYFLWSKNYDGPCEVRTIRNKEESVAERNLNEFDVFVRHPTAAKILRKVLKKNEKSVDDILTADTPFGLPTNFTNFTSEKKRDYVTLHYLNKRNRKIGYLPKSLITKNQSLIDDYKVFVPKAGSDGGQKIPDSVLGKPLIASPPAVCTQTFLAFYVKSEQEAQSLQSYYTTKFFRHLVSLRKMTQDALKHMYSWVPIQDWDREWTDKDLYLKYGLTSEEINYIETVIRPMTLDYGDGK